MNSDHCAELVGENGDVVISELFVADTFLTRLRGLIAQAPLGLQQALLITHCNSVHTFWMGYPLRLTFLDASGRVVRCVDSLKPNRICSCAGAVSVIEQNALNADPFLEAGKIYQIRRSPPAAA